METDSTFGMTKKAQSYGDFVPEMPWNAYLLLSHVAMLIEGVSSPSWIEPIAARRSGFLKFLGLDLFFSMCEKAPVTQKNQTTH